MGDSPYSAFRIDRERRSVLCTMHKIILSSTALPMSTFFLLMCFLRAIFILFSCPQFVVALRPLTSIRPDDDELIEVLSN